MRHIEPKFRVNQLVEVEWISFGVIKGLRRQGEYQYNWDTNTYGISNPEWEYLIFSFNSDASLDHTPWGWVEESKLSAARLQDRKSFPVG